ncbi:Acetylxylan esterase precursor [Rubripirellula tenax]|uniref:Acetylxylan esterase n=1 Tax=Rubripirellula tenax TaxID=2528015 RepID=A0A5C6FKR2_9BACT|nr:alpha/beta hydrolase [Rubripirellula tenax]TWU60649.1 Acetylxylan esterase precursor [Rubripirellula tenax]
MIRFAWVVILLSSAVGFSQDSSPQVEPVRTASDGPFIPEAALPGGIVLPLYAPDSPMLDPSRIHEAERYNTTGTYDRLLNTLNIHNPSIEVHLADGRETNGAAVIVAPGGGHKILWLGPEGLDLVPFFAEQGVSTIVLRNRLRVDGYDPMSDAVNDAFQAIRVVRAHAEQWNLDPNKIGMIGFSAGAELAAPAALFFDDFQNNHRGAGDPLANVSPRPDFVGLVYPGPTPMTREPKTAIPKNVPPSFIVCAGADDKVHAIWANDYFSPMLRAGVPNLEMHIYARGGHGGSIGDRGGIPFGTWPQRFNEWFMDLGFLGPLGETTKAARDVDAYSAR